MRTIVVFVFVFVFAVVSSSTAWGQGRTDVVTLANGDRITGEIKKLDRGRLEIKTDDAGTIGIEWDKVARVVAMREFEVETSDGRRFLGSLSQGAERVLVISASDGPVTLAMSEVTSIVRIGASFWAKLDGSVDAGFNYTRSSGIAQTTLNTNTLFRRPAFTVRLTTAATLTQREDDDERDDQGAVELSYARYRGRRRFVSGTARFESNESLGLLLRSQIGGVVGLRLKNTNRAQLEVGAGLAGNRETGVDTEPTRNVEAVFLMRSSYYTYESPKTNVDAAVQYYPSLSSPGRQRLQVDAAVKREVFKDFHVGLNTYYTLDTAPPNPAAARSDVGLTLSIGWTY